MTAYLATHPAGANWADYLQVGAIEGLALADEPDDARVAVRPTGIAGGIRPTSRIALDRRTTAQRVLTRAGSPKLTDEQREFLTRPQLAAYLRSLESWTIQTRLLVDVAQTIENFEQTRLPTDGHALGRLIRELALSADEQESPLGQDVGSALSQRERPDRDDRHAVESFDSGPTTDQRRGERANRRRPAHGRSTTMNDVHLKLIPHNNAWGVSFLIDGTVDSNTSSTAGPVTFVTQGKSSYQAEKGVYFTADGIRTMPATARAESRSNLAGLRTDYDNIPLAANFVRNIALQKHHEAHGASRTK
ncbi:MAG: hypothetical protein QM811_25345 [Pirellulales bacterium]